MPPGVRGTTLSPPLPEASNPMNTLPAEFTDLARFVPEWALATERERNEFRTRQPYARLQEFYDALMPRLEAITAYLNPLPLQALPRDAANLLELALMLMEVSPAVEYYQRPDVPESVDYAKYQIFPVAPRYRVLDSGA